MVQYTDFVHGMCGDEGYECVDGRVAPYENLTPCVGPGDDSPCTNPYAQPVTFSLSTPDPGEDPLGVTQACTSFSGWGDCYGGTVDVDLLDADDATLASIALTFEDEGDTTTSRTCVLRTVSDPTTAIPCAFSGEFIFGGGARCGGSASHPRLCGALEVELDGQTFQVPVALDAWVLGICF